MRWTKIRQEGSIQLFATLYLAAFLAGALAAGCQCAWLRGGIAGRSPKDDKLFTLPTLEIDALADLLRLI